MSEALGDIRERGGRKESGKGEGRDREQRGCEEGGQSCKLNVHVCMYVCSSTKTVYRRSLQLSATWPRRP